MESTINENRIVKMDGVEGSVCPLYSVCIMRPDRGISNKYRTPQKCTPPCEKELQCFTLDAIFIIPLTSNMITLKLDKLGDIFCKRTFSKCLSLMEFVSFWLPLTSLGFSFRGQENGRRKASLLRCTKGLFQGLVQEGIAIGTCPHAHTPTSKVSKYIQVQ